MFSGFTPLALEAEDPLKTRYVPVSTVWPGTKKVLTGLKSKCIRLGRGDPEVHTGLEPPEMDRNGSCHLLPTGSLKT